MKVFIVSDMEGVAGIVKWQQVTGGHAMYEEGRRLYTARSTLRSAARRPAARRRSSSWTATARARAGRSTR